MSLSVSRSLRSMEITAAERQELSTLTDLDHLGDQFFGPEEKPNRLPPHRPVVRLFYCQDFEPISIFLRHREPKNGTFDTDWKSLAPIVAISVIAPGKSALAGNTDWLTSSMADSVVLMDQRQARVRMKWISCDLLRLEVSARHICSMAG
ncbi:MAG: hypothetical protein ACJ74Y_09915 [Bryobacteraceae bacterium]